MAEILFNTLILIGYIIMLCISGYTLVFILTHRERFGVFLSALLNFLSLFNICLIYSTIYVLSITSLYNEIINIILWKLSLISGFTGLILTLLIYSFLKEFKHVPYFPFLYFMILFGLLIGSFFMPDSIQLQIIPDLDLVTYTFNFLTRLTITIFLSSYITYLSFLVYTLYKKARRKQTLKAFYINSFSLGINILMYILYVVLELWIFRELHFISLWITVASICYMIIKNPEMFLELTNKIYYINIYHKSGILLFSYKFNPVNNETDSTIWGNILIGINHILSEFVDTKDQIEVLQTDSSDIIVNYNDCGFAVVLITNRKNDILKKMMENFSKEFQEKYKNELIEIQDLNKLINVSEFKETKDIIEKNFQFYL